MLIEVKTIDRLRELMDNEPIHADGPYHRFVEFNKGMSSWAPAVIDWGDALLLAIDEGRLFFHKPRGDGDKYVLPKIMIQLAEKEMHHKVWWDYRESLSEDSINDIMDGKWDSVADELYELNVDYTHNLERDIIKSFVEDHEEYFRLDATEICEEADEDNELFRKEYLLSDMLSNEYSLYDYVYIDLNLEELADRSEAPILISITSNYDCVNSCHFEGAEYEYPESYVGSVIDALNLNPTTLAEEMEKCGMNLSGSDGSPLDDKPERNGNEVVDYREFCKDLANTSCGANLLTFLAKMPLKQLMNNQAEPKVITVPAGTPFTFFSTFYGGGSIMSYKTKRKVDYTLGNYTHGDWGAVIESGRGSYGPMAVYGCGTEIFGDEIDIKEWKEEKNNDKVAIQ